MEQNFGILQSGEKRLILAVLSDAVALITRQPPILGSRDHERAEAYDWIFNRNRITTRAPFSFAKCCEFLDLNTEAVRHAVRRALTLGKELNLAVTYRRDHLVTEDRVRLHRRTTVTA